MRKIYIIGTSYSFEGFFAIVHSILDHIIYAINNNYIPVVDMQHYANQYFKDNRIYKDNVWEYFFKQPFEINLNDLNNDDEIIISENVQFPNYEITIFNKDIPTNGIGTPILEKKKHQYKNLLKFNLATQNYLEENSSRILNNKNVLGILCRGTDYTKRRSFGEHIQPSVTSIITKTKQLLKKFPDIQNIYLATEDNEIYNRFKKEFGDLLLENFQYKYNYNDNENKLLCDITVNRKNHNYTLAKEYLLSIYILSKCKYFIGGKTTGTKWAWIMSENWAYSYIWELGNYGRSFKEKIFSITTQRKNGKSYKIMQILGIKLKKGLVAPFQKI